MTGHAIWNCPSPSKELSVEQLADALLAGLSEGAFCEQAAIGLLVDHGVWLRRVELRRGVRLVIGSDGVLRGWIDWAEVCEGPASSSEIQLLALVRSLSGQASETSLGELLLGLDRANTARVLRAIWIACRGPSESARLCATRAPSETLKVGQC